MKFKETYSVKTLHEKYGNISDHQKGSELLIDGWKITRHSCKLEGEISRHYISVTRDEWGKKYILSRLFTVISKEMNILRRYGNIRNFYPKDELDVEALFDICFGIFKEKHGD